MKKKKNIPQSKKKNLIIKKIIIFIFEIFLCFLIINNQIFKNSKFFNNEIKISLCTMGRKENLYVEEFVEYYIKLGIDHIFIYDDNEPSTEKISDALGNKYKNKVTIYENIKDRFNYQSEAFTNCYQNNLNKYDWFLMVDMDEYLYIVKNTLKNYLSSQIFNKCDFIKFHWVIPNDNNLLNYDSRPLFKRFGEPYMKSIIIKSIIRGNIKNLNYSIHAPFFSPKKNTSCNNEGRIVFSNLMNSEKLEPINIKRAYIIHYKFKSTEEFVNKYKRGYKDWFGNKTNIAFNDLINDFFSINKITIDKINYIEKELNLNLSEYRNKLNK